MILPSSSRVPLLVSPVAKVTYPTSLAPGRSTSQTSTRPRSRGTPGSWLLGIRLVANVTQSHGTFVLLSCTTFHSSCHVAFVQFGHLSSVSVWPCGSCPIGAVCSLSFDSAAVPCICPSGCRRANALKQRHVKTRAHAQLVTHECQRHHGPAPSERRCRMIRDRTRLKNWASCTKDPCA
eukprot:1352176-Pleurochrysis_carterae.AAC.1